MEAFIDSLAMVHPLLAPLARTFLIAIVVLALWIVISIPAAICYSALRTALQCLAGVLLKGAESLFSQFQVFWSTALGMRATAIAKLTLRYVYDSNERKLLKILQRVGGESIAVGQLIEKTHRALDTSLSPLKREIRLIVDGSHGVTGLIAIPDIQDMQASSQMRRTSLVMLFAMLPLAVALVTINTSLLTKFFESFFEEYISYQLGIKWAQVFALMFSFFELAFGVLIYYIGKASNKDNGMVTALLKTLIIFLIAGLALVESYLYLLLSIDIAGQTKEMPVNLPAILESIRTWWLAPIGFVIVIGLSLIGHFIVDGLNRFFEAGHVQDLRGALAEAKRSISRMDSVWDSIQKRVGEAKLGLVSFESRIVGDTPSPLSALTTLGDMNSRLSLTVQAIVNARREPVSSISTSEAEGLFDTHVFNLGVIVIALIAFCWLQTHFLGLIPAFVSTDKSIFLIVGILEAAALLIAGYKAYPNTSTYVEGIGTESLHSPGEWLMTAACHVVIIAALMSNIFLTMDDSAFIWGVFSLIAVLAISILVVLGRTLSLLMFVTSTLLRQLALAFFALSIFLLSVLVWLMYTFAIGARYFLYLLAYPLLFIFWKSLLEKSNAEIPR